MLKKAQTAIGLMPLIAIALSAAALVAMYSSSNGITSQSESLASMVEEIQLNQGYILEQVGLLARQTSEQCPSCSDTELKSKFRGLALEKEKTFRFEGAGNFYGKIRNSDFEIENGILKIRGLFAEANQGHNSIKRNFDIEIVLG